MPVRPEAGLYTLVEVNERSLNDPKSYAGLH
jgi:hypothetical protein